MEYVETSHALLIQSEYLYSELEMVALTPECGDECEDRMFELAKSASYAFSEVYQDKFDFLFVLPYLPMPSYNEDTLGKMFRMEGVSEQLLGTAILNMEPYRYGEPYQNLHLIASYWGSRLVNPFLRRGKGAWGVSGLNVAGQLGGWAIEDFECVDPLGASLSSSSNECNTNVIRVPSELGGKEHGDDSNPIFAKIELMLMGILDEEELQNDNEYIIRCKDAQLNDQFKIPTTDVPFSENVSSYAWSSSFPLPSEIDPDYYGDQRIMNHYRCSDILTFSPADINTYVTASSIGTMEKNTELTLGFMVLFPTNTSLTEGLSDDIESLNIYLQNFTEMFTAATLGYASATTKLAEIVEPEIEKKSGWVENNITAVVIVIVAVFVLCLTLAHCLYVKYSRSRSRRRGYQFTEDNEFGVE